MIAFKLKKKMECWCPLPHNSEVKSDSIIPCQSPFTITFSLSFPSSSLLNFPSLPFTIYLFLYFYKRIWTLHSDDPVFKSKTHFLVVWLWADHVISLSLNFPNYWKRIKSSPFQVTERVETDNTQKERTRSLVDWELSNVESQWGLVDTTHNLELDCLGFESLLQYLFTG